MSLAVFTIVQDEPDLLPLWVEHYRRYAPDCELYVLAHDVAGDTALYLENLRSDADATVVPVHRAESFDYEWITRTVEDFMAFLLRSHEIVGFSEVDELVMPVPAMYESLYPALSADQPFFRATGYCVVHHHPEEPDMDWTQPLLAQRKHWYRSERYSKICFARMPVQFKHGFHGAWNVPAALPASAALRSIHLHQADYQTTLRRHQRNAGRFWAPEFRLADVAVHQRLDNPADLERYLLCTLDNPTEYATLEPIPTIYHER